MSDKLNLDPDVSAAVRELREVRHKRGGSEPPTRESRDILRSVKEDREIDEMVVELERDLKESEGKVEKHRRSRTAAGNIVSFREIRCPHCETAASSDVPIATIQYKPWEHTTFPSDIKLTADAQDTTNRLTLLGNNGLQTAQDNLGNDVLADHNNDFTADIELGDYHLTEEQQNAELQFSTWNDEEKSFHIQGSLWDQRHFLLNKMFVRCVAEITSFEEQEFCTFMQRSRADQCQILDDYIHTAIYYANCIKFNPFADVDEVTAANCLSEEHGFGENIEEDEEERELLAPFREYAAPYPWFGFIQSMLLPHGTFRYSKTPKSVNGKAYHFSENDLDAFLALSETDQCKWFIYFNQKLEAAGLSNRPKGSVKVYPNGLSNYVNGDPSPWMEPYERPGFRQWGFAVWNDQPNSHRIPEDTVSDLSGHSNVGLISISCYNCRSSDDARDGSFDRLSEMRFSPAKTYYC